VREEDRKLLLEVARELCVPIVVKVVTLLEVEVPGSELESLV
jgi:hypothetical protein